MTGESNMATVILTAVGWLEADGRKKLLRPARSSSPISTNLMVKCCVQSVYVKPKMLRSNLIFIHGPSGSGKGELARVLISNFELQSYQVFYGASGDFFRAAMANNPQLASEMNSGKYIDSLYGIATEIKKLATKWKEAGSNGVLILDGVIRRLAFDNYPSQLDQIAEFLGTPKNELMATTHIVVNANMDDLYNQLSARNIGRSDDHDVAIKKRLANWVEHVREAVIDLGYVMNAQGELSSTKPNLLTINNGAHYGVGLEEFREKCGEIFSFLINND